MKMFDLHLFSGPITEELWDQVWDQIFKQWYLFKILFSWHKMHCY